MIAIKVNTTKGIVSLGSSPLRMTSGSTQIKRRIKNGNIERGATSPPYRDDNSGKEVNGRQMSAIAQTISHIFSKLFPNELDVSIYSIISKAIFESLYR